jgi:pimeloyl-ACP methyl ester carboxylesterase
VLRLAVCKAWVVVWARPRLLTVIWMLLMAALVACGSAGAKPPATSSPSVPASPSPPPLDVCVQPSDHAREVVFNAASEDVIGAEFGSGSVGVVLAHEYPGSLCGWVSYAEHLRDQGRRAFAFDFGRNTVADVIGAATELRREGATQIVLMGASMGANASLVAASSISPPIAGVASLSGPSYFQGIDALVAVKQLTLPVLFMDARDSMFFPADAKAMFAACPSHHKRLLLLPGTDHGTQLLHFDVAAQAQSALDMFIVEATA